MKVKGETEMKGKMKAAVLHKPLDLRVEDVNIPQISSHEVLVKMKRVGICGSDVHYYLEGQVASFIVKKPLILGHECSGEIVEIGDEVKNLKVGQRVVIEPGFTCGKCEYCRSGRYNLCREVKFYATPPYDGTFAEYASAPEQNVYVMPDEMSYDDGAMIEPLAVGMMAAKMGEVTAQDTVVVLGAGPIGQMALQASKTYGALEIFVTDIVEYRLEYARKYGANETVNSAKEDVIEKIQKLTKNKGVDVVIEASGASQAIQQAIEVVKPGGRIVLVGYPPGDVQIPIPKVISKELRIQGIHRYANVYSTAIKAVSSGRAVVKPYVTHVFPLKQIKEAFEANINKTGNPMKIQIAI
jgi:L-iditol 2-dehydrogenase